MSTGTRLPLAQATGMANAIIMMLEPYCERIEIAGSIRRKCDTVGDIEIVCVPKIEPGERDMFGDTTSYNNLLDDRVMDLLDRGLPKFAHRLDKNGRSACGPRYKRLLYEGFPLDLFSVLPPAQWGVIMTIRTGPADFSKRVVTQQEKGGLLPNIFEVREGHLFWLHAQRGNGICDTPEEYDFFDEIGLEWIEPEDRR